MCWIRSGGCGIGRRFWKPSALLNSQGNLSLYKVTTSQAAAKLFRHSEWCVKDPKFFRQYGAPFYYLEKDGKPFKLLHFGNKRKEITPQVRDAMDAPTRLDEFERLGLDLTPLRKDMDWVVGYANDTLKNRWLSAEPYILKNAVKAGDYALHVIRGRWPEAESVILKNPEAAAQYAKKVLKRRWPEAEPTIRKDAIEAFLYAKDVIRGRWPEAEPIIMRNPSLARHYAVHVIKGRWPEAEPIIMDSPVASEYTRHFKG